MIRESNVTTKECIECGKSKPISSFYRVSKVVSADERMQICSECIAKKYDVNNMKDVIALLRLTDRPFIQNIWNKQKEKWGDDFSLGRYLRVVSSGKNLKDQTFADSDHLENGNDQNIIDANQVDTIVTEDGEEILYSDQMVFDWGTGFSKLEYLRMEKLFKDSLAIYSISTPFDTDQLRGLVKLSILKDQSMMSGDSAKFDKYRKAYDDTLKNLAIRPIDRKGKDQQAGIKSFSQIFRVVERDGFVAPKAEVIHSDNEDIFDKMIISMLNYYNRIVGSELLSEVPLEEKEIYSSMFGTDGQGALTEDEKSDIKIKQADLAQQREIVTPNTQKVDENED